MYTYDLDEIKNSLTIEQVNDILAELGAEPQMKNELIVCKTICHAGDHHKLWYYSNTALFKCYSDCGDTFDIFELVRKVKTLELQIEYTLPMAVQYVAGYFGFAPKGMEDDIDKIEDWELFHRYEKIKDIDPSKKVINLPSVDGSFLKNLPRPRILSWEEDGISKEVMDFYEICYEPSREVIVIPHRDANGNLVGIRQRTMIKEVAEKYGKYMPLRLGKNMYNHALSYNLYGLYQNKDNIRKAQKAIVLESEKSVMQYATMFGQDENIAVACCGSSFIAYQCQLLIDAGAREIIIALDRQFQELGDDEHLKLVKNLKNIHKKYGQFVTISYIFDKEKITPYKASPTDCGIDTFLYLYKRRVNLYES